MAEKLGAFGGVLSFGMRGGCSVKGFFIKEPGYGDVTIPIAGHVS